MFSKKATKIDKIFIVEYVVSVKQTVKISSLFVAFLENTNFTSKRLHKWGIFCYFSTLRLTNNFMSYFFRIFRNLVKLSDFIKFDNSVVGLLTENGRRRRLALYLDTQKRRTSNLFIRDLDSYYRVQTRLYFLLFTESRFSRFYKATSYFL